MIYTLSTPLAQLKGCAEMVQTFLARLQYAQHNSAACCRLEAVLARASVCRGVHVQRAGSHVRTGAEFALLR
jgi:hypothetical protein